MRRPRVRRRGGEKEHLLWFHMIHHFSSTSPAYVETYTQTVYEMCLVDIDVDQFLFGMCARLILAVIFALGIMG